MKRLLRGKAFLLGLILLFWLSLVEAAAQGWYSSSWQHRKKITIDHLKVSSGPLASFPVLINRTDGDLSSKARSDGFDILFTSSDGLTKLNHEREEYTSVTGELVAWVLMSSLSSTVDADIYMYYGNSGAADQQNATGAWDSNFKAVWHMKESTGGSGAISDATSNGNHGTDHGSPTFGATGKIGNAVSFDGVDDYVSAADSPSLAITGPGTLSTWYRLSVLGTWRSLVDKGVTNDDNSTHNYGMEFGPDNTLLRVIGNGTTFNAVTSAATFTNTTSFHYMVYTWDGTNHRLYFDGALNQTDAQTITPAASTAPVFIGAWASVLDFFHGRIDEVRIANTARSAGWILTEYNNQDSPSTFYSVGAEEQYTLPIQLSSFTATVVNQNHVRLDWTTLTELNNYGFEVQRSATIPNGYQTIPNSFIPGHGTTNEPQHYSWVDSTVTPGAWYYRLKQIDLDGTAYYSDGIRIDLLAGVIEPEIPAVFSLSQNYPNPFNPSTIIRYGLPYAASVMLTIHNLLGQQVAQLVNEQQRAGYHDVVFRGDGFASGLYFYRLDAGKFTSVKTLVLMK